MSECDESAQLREAERSFDVFGRKDLQASLSNFGETSRRPLQAGRDLSADLSERPETSQKDLRSGELASFTGQHKTCVVVGPISKI